MIVSLQLFAKTPISLGLEAISCIYRLTPIFGLSPNEIKGSEKSRMPDGAESNLAIVRSAFVALVGWAPRAHQSADSAANMSNKLHTQHRSFRYPLTLSSSKGRRLRTGASTSSARTESETRHLNEPYWLPTPRTDSTTS